MQQFLNSISTDSETGQILGNVNAASDLAGMFTNALDKGRFLVVLQPVVDAVTWRLLQNECLLRYRRTRDGELVAAGQIVPLAEEIDIVTELDKFALQTAARLLQVSPNLQLSVNVSRRSLVDIDLRDIFTNLVARFPQITKHLIVEITETALPDRKTDLQDFVRFLHHAGFRVAIDDFGVGATSWRELATLDIDIVKFDMSLCAPDSEKADLLIETIAKSKERGIYTIGEGVDSIANAKRLRGLGIDALQGFLFGRPLP